MDRLTQIRESERKSHEEMYANEELYKRGSWLRKPIKTVLDLLPLFENCKNLNVLDLGCGVGRNCIAVARHYQDIPCNVECVDILDLAIEKLYQNAAEYGVVSMINGVVSPIEEYVVKAEHYDLIMAISALEHIDSVESFTKKLEEIVQGVRKGGVVCLVINSEVQEKDKSSGEELSPQFEVNLPTEKLQKILQKTFESWELLKSSVQAQHYDIPRAQGICELKTNVVTYVVRKR